MNNPPDRIEKRIALHAPHERVWRAIGEAKRFGNWFGVEFDRKFAAGICGSGDRTNV